MQVRQSGMRAVKLGNGVRSSAPRVVYVRAGADDAPTTSTASSTTSSSTSTTATATTEVKVQNTLSALDAMLGVQDKPKPVKTEAPPRAPPAPSQPAAPQAWPSSVDLAKQRQAKNALDVFETLMNFEGYAPEVINCRVAMLGFMAAMSGELRTGESIVTQFIGGGGLAATAVIAFVIIASFAPAVRQVPWDQMFGKDKTPTTFGPFNPNAELRNGRLAMIGLVALLLLEGANPQAFFS